MGVSLDRPPPGVTGTYVAQARAGQGSGLPWMAAFAAMTAEWDKHERAAANVDKQGYEGGVEERWNSAAFGGCWDVSKRCLAAQTKEAAR